MIHWTLSFFTAEVYLPPPTYFSTLEHREYPFSSRSDACQVLQDLAKINYLRNATRLDLKSSEPALNHDRPTCLLGVCVGTCAAV